MGREGPSGGGVKWGTFTVGGWVGYVGQGTRRSGFWETNKPFEESE